MVRVHEGMPLHPLPMIVPSQPNTDLQPPTTRGAPRSTQGAPGDSLGDAVMGILNGLLGGR